MGEFDSGSLSFGEWLRRRRGGLGLTQAALARDLGCASITLRKIEAEERRPSSEMAHRLAVCLRLPPEQHAAFARFARGEVRAGELLTGPPTHAPSTATGHAPNVPIPPYDIVGREALLLRASPMLTGANRARVLTLAGPPGVGKTRLALELAHSLHGRFADGAVFVELAPVLDAALVPAAVAQAVRVEDSNAADTSNALFAALRDREMLLVLDNFEHVLNAAPFVAELAAHCAQVVCLVTSRERLRIRAEHALRIEPLEVPKAANVRPNLPMVQDAPASRLFIARARQANAQLALTDADAGPIGQLCAELDGLPLALELLAARADLFTPAELHADLVRGLSALDDGPRDLPERHRSLRNAIQWSVRLLSEPQRTLFAHLAVFAGSFDAEAAQAVLAHDPADLAALEQGSLVQAFGANRWRLLEPIRQYAEEMLAERGQFDEAKTRHAIHEAAIAEAARNALLGPDAVAWTQRLEADHANMQAAIGWSLRARRPAFALRIGQGIWRYWFRRGLWREGLAWLDEALALDQAINPTETPIDIRGKALRAAGVMAHTLSRYAVAEKHYQAALALAYQQEDDADVAAIYCNIGILYKDEGRFDEALTYFDRSMEFQPERAMKFSWQSKADTLLRLGRLDEAEVLFRQAKALNERIGDDEGLAHTLRGLAEMSWRRGQLELAEAYLRENDALCRKLDHARGLSWTAQQFGNVARARGQMHEAAAHYAEALEQMQRMGDQWGVCEVLAECAHWAVLMGQESAAARWIGMASEGFRALGAKLTPYEQRLIDASLSVCRESMGEPALAQALRTGARDWHASAVGQVIAELRTAVM